MRDLLGLPIAGLFSGSAQKGRRLSLRASEGVEGRHDVVGRLEELEDAILELLLLVGGQLVRGVVLLECLLSADAEHLRHEGDVCFCCGSLHFTFNYNTR